jgi:hypothetical protein
MRQVSSLAGIAVPWRLGPALRHSSKTLIIGLARHVLAQWCECPSRMPDRRLYALQVPVHSGTCITVGPLTGAEAARWEVNLAASVHYLTGLTIGGKVRRIPCGAGLHDIDPAAVPDHTGSISIALLSAWASPGIDLIERLRISLCGQYGPERARQLMASVPNSYEARRTGASG